MFIYHFFTFHSSSQIPVLHVPRDDNRPSIVFDLETRRRVQALTKVWEAKTMTCFILPNWLSSQGAARLLSSVRKDNPKRSGNDECQGLAVAVAGWHVRAWHDPGMTPTWAIRSKRQTNFNSLPTGVSLSTRERKRTSGNVLLILIYNKFGSIFETTSLSVCMLNTLFSNPMTWRYICVFRNKTKIQKKSKF